MLTALGMVKSQIHRKFYGQSAAKVLSLIDERDMDKVQRLNGSGGEGFIIPMNP